MNEPLELDVTIRDLQFLRPQNRLDGHDQDIAALIETVQRPPEPEPELRPVLGFTPPPKRQRRAQSRHQAMAE
jgi:hypothetical protein